MSRRLNLNLLVYRKPARCLNKIITAIAIYFPRGVIPMSRRLQLGLLVQRKQAACRNWGLKRSQLLLLSFVKI